MEIAGVVEINGPPTENDVKQIVDLGMALARKIKVEVH
jgi:hypothetical protein